MVLPGADYFVRLLDGRIDVQGTPESLREQGILDTLTKESHANDQTKVREEAKEEDAIEETPKPPGGENKRPRQLVKDEARETGGVQWRIYKAYLKASGYYTWAILATGIVLYQLTGVAEKLWIKQWGEGYDDVSTAMHYLTPNIEGEWEPNFFLRPTAHVFNVFKNVSTAPAVQTAAIELPSATTNPLFYVGIYAAISFGATFIYISNVIIQYNGALRGSRVMFKQLLVAVVRATMRWHDSTPTGVY